MPKRKITLNNLDQPTDAVLSISEPVFTETNTTFRFHFVDEDDNDVDISGWLINFSAFKDGDIGKAWDGECSDVNDGTDGKCETEVSGSDISESGFYTGEVRWTKSGNSSDPEDGRQHLKFTVKEHKIK